MQQLETVISSEHVFTGHIVHLRVDTVRLPDGREAKREIVAHRGAVCMAPLLEDGSILMVRQFRLAAGNTLLEVPAGTLEAGEEPLACAYRELEEETGYAAKEMRPLFAAYLAPGYSTELIHAFLATGLYKPAVAASADADENLVLVQMPLDEVVEMVMRGEIQDSKSISSILAVSHLRNGA